MFDQLRKDLSQIKEKKPVNLSDFYDTIALIENLCPEIWTPRMKGYTKQAARVLWMRWLVGREIESSKELYGDEMWLIHAFITGLSGQFTKDIFGDEFQALNASANQAELVQWLTKYQGSVRRFAELIIAPKERNKQKVYRQRRKEQEAQQQMEDDNIPF